MRPLAYERSKLFDQEAERYDRCRPTYPDALIDELLGPEPAGLEVLDVGCGTGIASRQMAERGAKVLGVELAPRMAEIARSHGIDVELGAFEGWDAAGRTFDRVSRSDHTALEPEVLDRLLEGIGAAIDDHGGSFVMNFETVLITATRLG